MKRIKVFVTYITNWKTGPEVTAKINEWLDNNWDFEIIDVKTTADNDHLVTTIIYEDDSLEHPDDREPDVEEKAVIFSEKQEETINDIIEDQHSISIDLRDESLATD